MELEFKTTASAEYGRKIRGIRIDVLRAHRVEYHLLAGRLLVDLADGTLRNGGAWVDVTEWPLERLYSWLGY